MAAIGKVLSVATKLADGNGTSPVGLRQLRVNALRFCRQHAVGSYVEAMVWPLPGVMGQARLYGDPLTRPAPAGESAGCGPPSPPKARDEILVGAFQNVETPDPGRWPGLIRWPGGGCEREPDEF